MRDSFVASLDMVSDPGVAQAYNNCGYYLLSRVLAKKRNRSTPMCALTDFLFSPLHISCIRRGTSLVAKILISIQPQLLESYYIFY